MFVFMGFFLHEEVFTEWTSVWIVSRFDNLITELISLFEIIGWYGSVANIFHEKCLH